MFYVWHWQFQFILHIKVYEIMRGVFSYIAIIIVFCGRGAQAPRGVLSAFGYKLLAWRDISIFAWV